MPYHYLACTDASVFANTFQKIGAILVESLYQRFILAPYPLVGMAHHFCRDIYLTVRYMLVMLDDLRFDVVQSLVDIPYFDTLAFGSVAFRIPKYFRDGLFVTEQSNVSIKKELPLIL